MNIDPDKNHRILIIDDNKAIHEDFRKILTRPKAQPNNMAEAEAALFGDAIPRITLPEFQIDSAFQGQEGLDLIAKSLQENHPYAMAFVDVRMPPGWDGVETTAQIWQKYPISRSSSAPPTRIIRGTRCCKNWAIRTGW